uniref:ABC transporter permease n=1 Tax=Ignisphaera aggregans TaxID=334771 RepID=A0A7J3QGM5_9CREN
MIENLLNVFTLSMLFMVLGNIIIERSGIINLSIDGVVTLAIAISYVLMQRFEPILSVFIVVLLIVAIAFIISLFINILHSSHILTGLSMNIALYGLSATIGVALSIERTIKQVIIPQSYVIILALIVTFMVWILLYKTKIGTLIRACGFNPRASEFLGIKVWKVRTIALAIGYTLIALGSYIYIVAYRGAWIPYSGMGNGFLALALAIASSWHPILALLITILFVYFYTSIYILQLIYGMPAAIVNMLPFTVSIAIVTIIQITPIKKKLTIPRALGEVYFKEERAT